MALAATATRQQAIRKCGIFFIVSPLQMAANIVLRALTRTASTSQTVPQEFRETAFPRPWELYCMARSQLPSGLLQQSQVNHGT